VGSNSVSLMRATDELMTGMVILLNKDYITLISLAKVVLSQNLNIMPLNQAFVLYSAFFKLS
jgi:hypothetical protein